MVKNQGRIENKQNRIFDIKEIKSFTFKLNISDSWFNYHANNII